jgi:hypothetical protein
MKNKYISFFYILYIFTITIFLFNSCKKPKKPIYYSNPLGEAKEYLWANLGSYWIYQNDKTGELDTQTIIAAKNYWKKRTGTRESTKHITIEYEYLIRQIYSTYNKWKYDDMTAEYNPDASRTQKVIVNRDAYGAPGSGQTNPFRHPFVLNDRGGSGVSITTCTNTDTTIILNGKAHEHIAVFRVFLSGIDERKTNCLNPTILYYWEKDIGLIKKDMTKCGYSWDLIDYNIIK